MTQTVLIAGATGMLGSRIAHYLLAEPEAEVRLLLRPGALADVSKKAALQPLLERGAQSIEGDLSDIASLDRAMKGVDVVVSAVQGGPEIIIDGQVALANAGRANGVRRFLPSDFALDLFEAPPGEHALLDMRRAADEQIAASGLEHVHVLNGAFMEILLSPFSEVLDEAEGVVRYWGDGGERFDVTSVEDTARYTAKAAVDRDLPSGKFAVAGQQISFGEMADAYETVTGRRVRRERRGSIEDLRVWIGAKRASDPDPMATVPATYQLYMVSGLTALRDLRNARYPQIEPESFTAYLRRTLVGKTS